MQLLNAHDIVLNERDFRKISELVYNHCGINLHDGKKELVRARLAKRLRLGNFRSFPEYMQHVLNDRSGKEFSILIDSLSTNLTNFFREQKHFEYLNNSFLPDLEKRKRESKCFRIRAWSAGCSTGEEPYSIAVNLLEAFERKGRWNIKVLATDISTSVLEKARKGKYEKEKVKDIPALIRNKYLLKRRDEGKEFFEVTPQLRQIVIFKYLNLIENWPVTGPLDFIFCRNVMIYFDKPTQQNLVERFWKLLNAGGLLFTGHSESLTGINHRFGYVQPTIYIKS